MLRQQNKLTEENTKIVTKCKRIEAALQEQIKALRESREELENERAYNTHPDNCSKLQRDRIEKRKLKEKRDDAVRYIDELFNASPNGVINVYSFRCVKGISYESPNLKSLAQLHLTKRTRGETKSWTRSCNSSVPFLGNQAKGNWTIGWSSLPPMLVDTGKPSCTPKCSRLLEPSLPQNWT